MLFGIREKTLQYILFLVFVLDFIYAVTENQIISDTTLFLILQTNLHEGIDYIVNHPGFPLFLVINVIFVVAVLFNNIKYNFKLVSIVPLILVLAVFPFTSLGKNVIAAVNDLDKMRARREVNLNTLTAENVNAKGKTHIFLIGESSSRDYWSLYGYDKETTPFMEKVFSNCRNCTFVRDAYSCDKLTEYSLSMALTEANQYDDKKFKTSFSIIDVLKKQMWKQFGYQIKIFGEMRNRLLILSLVRLIGNILFSLKSFHTLTNDRLMNSFCHR